MNSKKTISLLVTASLLLIGCSHKPQTLTDNFDEKKMEQAIADARASFDGFLVRFHSPQPGDKDFHVKVRIEDEHGVEHFWVSDLKLDSEPYSGRIADEPGIVKKVKYGQEYSFARAEVSDWMYMSNDKMQGNYTLRVELESMPPKEADALKKKIGW